mmetsp:Transcript_39931/g.38485  ORF Transcript_39931/g.38485 Transcript_39931/m.38485 type:complete len:101 (-) Transcript_39931:591-893(-)
MGRTVPESLKKVRARAALVLKNLKEGRDKCKKERVDKRKVYLAHAEKYHKEHTQQQRALIDAKRSAKASGNFFVEGQPKIALVIRIKGINKLPPKEKKIM